MMWTTGTIRTKTMTAPDAADLLVSLDGDAGESDTMTLAVSTAVLAQAPDYVEQQIAARLRLLNLQPELVALLDAITEGTVYALDQSNPASAVSVSSVVV